MTALNLSLQPALLRWAREWAGMSPEVWGRENGWAHLASTWREALRRLRQRIEATGRLPWRDPGGMWS